MDRLFVYGSLQPGAPNEHVLAAVKGDWEPAVVRGRLVEAGWGAAIGYPGLVIDEDGESIRGHVLAARDLGETWAVLDELEGEEYERTIVTVTTLKGEQVDAHIYVLRS